MELFINNAKLVVVECISLASLLMAGVALVLIEFWGIKKIWHLVMGDSGGKNGAIQ